MPGFLGYSGKINDVTFPKEIRNDLVIDHNHTDDLFIERRTVDKFLNDKIFSNSEDYFILTEGVILNSKALIIKYKQNNLENTILQMYKMYGETFFNEFRGSFSGMLYDKKKGIKLIFTDHIGSKQIFYSEMTGGIFFGSDINYIIDFFKENAISYTLNRDAAYFLLTYGFMIEEHTMFNEIKKLRPGNYIKIENNTLEVAVYYQFDNTPNHDQSEEEIIEKVDTLFRQAVTRAFEKDKEYGYKHLVTLSGGLDSRMTTWVAHVLGYGGNIVNVTFSQSDYLDETIPKQIAADLKHEWIFKALDNGLFLKNIDDTVRQTSGGALFSSTAHSKSCIDLIDKNQFGISHSGQLAGALSGVHYRTLDQNEAYSITAGAFSTMLGEKLKESLFSHQYKNVEIFKFYARGFSGINQGLLPTQEHMETYSPFYDLDFMEYCFTIPVELRFKHNIYFKWILKKYPEADKYIWEHTQSKISAKHINIFGRKILLKQFTNKVIKYLFKKIGLIKSTSSFDGKNHMNPLNYWYRTNEDLRKYLDSYFNENIKLLDNDKELKKDCEYLYANGGTTEKSQVLTLLSVMKLYFKGGTVSNG